MRQGDLESFENVAVLSSWKANESYLWVLWCQSCSSLLSCCWYLTLWGRRPGSLDWNFLKLVSFLVETVPYCLGDSLACAWLAGCPSSFRRGKCGVLGCRVENYCVSLDCKYILNRFIWERRERGWWCWPDWFSLKNHEGRIFWVSCNESGEPRMWWVLLFLVASIAETPLCVAWVLVVILAVAKLSSFVVWAFYSFGLLML